MRKQYWLFGAPMLALALATDLSAAPTAPRNEGRAASGPLRSDESWAPRMSQDDAWLAFTGCWRPVGDVGNNYLCIVPAGEGVRIVTLVDGKVQSQSNVVADDRARRMEQEGCSGTERAVWSGDKQRVFLRSDLMCGNVPRKVSGVFALLSPTEWISVQAVSSGEAAGTRTVKYTEATPATLPDDIAQALSGNRLARETVRTAAAAKIDLDDVREAVAKVDAVVVESWLMATAQPFDLDGKTLIELADAGVPSSVIDVIVAVSNPKRFAIREERLEERDPRSARRPSRTSCYDDFYSPLGGLWYDPFAYRYRGYGYDSCRGGLIGLSPWGYGGGWGYYGPTVIVVEPQNRGGKATREGYSRGRGTGSSGTPGSETSIGRTAQPRNPGSSTGSSTTTTTKSTGSDDGGRKAKPRTGN